jgi:hypothetical protein
MIIKHAPVQQRRRSLYRTREHRHCQHTSKAQDAEYTGNHAAAVGVHGRRPEADMDYEQIIRAFERDHQAAIEEFLLELIAKLREIRLVEFTFSNNPGTSEKDGLCNRLEFGQR